MHPLHGCLVPWGAVPPWLPQHPFVPPHPCVCRLRQVSCEPAGGARMHWHVNVLGQGGVDVACMPPARARPGTGRTPLPGRSGAGAGSSQMLLVARAVLQDRLWF